MRVRDTPGKGGGEKWTLSKVKSSMYSCLELVQYDFNCPYSPSQGAPVDDCGSLVRIILAFSELLKLAATSSRLHGRFYSQHYLTQETLSQSACPCQDLVH
jgi:hypothetical protein